MTSAALLLDHERETMIVRSDLLGPVTVDPSDVIRFPAGLFGFPDCNAYVLLPAEQEGLYWLQSTEHSALAFVLVDPFRLFEGYSVELAPGDLAELGGGKQGTRQKVIILAIVTLPPAAGEPATANLQGPVAIDLGSNRGKQLALGESPFGVQCGFDLGAIIG